ncbi:Tetratricopeptide-like helical [Moelleriella libera RCEF 2490]|uniref:Tetratricopeptide-like helical n=1 Tax=Moelleriella libera RCEF 2490 TaxID=1081109 RepID=A0A168ACJ2_9HYPO|nr:Tetratricopeptide-like helical [Moelleriella libera RCEF 2490]
MALDPRDYQIALIAPLHIEARAVICLLDRKHDGHFALQCGDDYVFRAGEMCQHNVVIATLPAGQEYGTASAAALASQVKKFFPSLWFGLLVGVAAGLPKLTGPYPRDIRLGDILVALPDGESAGLVAYGLGKETKDGFRLLRNGHVLAMTETVVRAAIGDIKLQAPDDFHLVKPYYEEIKDKEHIDGTFVDPGQDADVLYTVDDSGASRVEARDPRPSERRTRIWYGPIGSGDKLMKNAAERDALRDQHGLIGLEMEAAGTMNRIPVGVIRAACDYGDEHKNKQWQPYAAAMAGAFAKALLARVPPRKPVGNQVPPRNPVVCHIPYKRSTTFSGREAQLEQVKCKLFSEARGRVAIAGLGGMGKTQIALELAYRVHHMESMDDQLSVLWMPAQSLAAFHEAATVVARKLRLGIDGPDDVKEVLRDYLSSDVAGQWLLVLDNLDDESVFDGEVDKSKGLRDFLPQSWTGRILITTRSFPVATDVAGADVIELDAMRPDEALTFLNRALRIKPEGRDLACSADLLERLAYMPLTIGQAVSYMNKTRQPISVYLSHWDKADKADKAEQGMNRLLRKFLRDETHHDATQGAVATTWIVSFEAICDKDAGAARVLSFIQWIDYKAIPLSILPITGSEADLRDSIGVICEYGFLTWRQDDVALDMHRLVHLALRCWPKKLQEGLRKAEVGEHLLNIFPPPDWESRATWRQLLPHVLTLVKDDQSSRDKAILELAYQASLCLSVDGRIIEMLQYIRVVVAVRTETLAETHPDRLASQHMLAIAYLSNGQVQDAVKLLQYIVAIQEKTLVETHPDYLASQHELAYAYLANGQVQDAVKLFQYIVAIREKTLAETHPSCLASQYGLARAYLANGQDQDAVKLFQHVVAIMEKTLAETYPDRLASQYGLMCVYQANG